MTEETPKFSTPHLFVEAVAQLAGLVRTEIRLARTELSEKAAKAASAVALISASVVLLLAALIVLLQGAVAWLVAIGLPPHWAALAVGAVVGFIGLALLLIALTALKSAADFRPERALDQMSKDMAVVQGTAAREAVR